MRLCCALNGAAHEASCAVLTSPQVLNGAVLTVAMLQGGDRTVWLAKESGQFDTVPTAIAVSGTSCVFRRHVLSQASCFHMHYAALLTAVPHVSCLATYMLD